MPSDVNSETQKNKPNNLTDALLQSNLNEMNLFGNVNSHSVLTNKTYNNSSSSVAQPNAIPGTWTQPRINSFGSSLIGCTNKIIVFFKLVVRYLETEIKLENVFMFEN